MSDQENAAKRPVEEPAIDEEIPAKRARVEEPSSTSSPITQSELKDTTDTSKTEEGSVKPTSGSTTIVTTPSSTPIPLPIIPNPSHTIPTSFSTDNQDRPREAEENETTTTRFTDHLNAPHRNLPEPISRLGLRPLIPILPDSLQFIIGGSQKIDLTERKGFVGELECGIRGFVGKDNKGVRGVIKQRFSDFLVNEVSLDGTVLHLNDITKPKEPESEKSKLDKKAAEESTSNSGAPLTEEGKEAAEKDQVDLSSLPESLRTLSSHAQWSHATALKLKDHLSDESIISLHGLSVQGKEPPPKSDNGWGARKSNIAKAEEGAINEEEAAIASAGTSMMHTSYGGRGQGRDRGRGRGGRNGGRDGRGSQGGWKAEDTREVLSQPITSKDARTAAHKILRECFGSTFESSTRDVPGEEGSRLVIKYATAHNARGGGGGGNGQWNRQSDKPKLPQYIHFTLHKTNRETMDALGHLTRMFGAHPKDLSVCGTKDKRAVTVQRVCLKRNGKTLQHVWKSANGILKQRRDEQQAIEERGERGVRIGDLAYSDKYLELGMLKGNQFVITLRNVQEASIEEIDKTMTSVRDHGFINFYGMQRFGTSSWPTHLTGLLILQSKWSEAIDSILHLREGEHPDCSKARLAWLEDKDPKKAFDLMPRRGVAERCIWDFWSKNRVEDKVGALNSIPRNLKTMYVHAYQSYVWNLIVSERIKISSTEPIVGDLVFVDKDALGEGDVPNPDSIPAHAKDRKGRPIRKWATSSSPEVKQLTEEDLPNYSIFDVVMPLPGWDIDYPGGEIGEKLMKILKLDELDGNKMRRDQRDFSLPGSYRRIIIKPISLNWNHLNYTDPDVSLVQSDEDKILNLNPPPSTTIIEQEVQGGDDDQGKFKALKIELTLGSSTYATMVLREITREETSTWHQIGLTMNGQDREYKGVNKTEGEGAAGRNGQGQEQEEKKEDNADEEDAEGEVDEDVDM
ncbi:uncharacterized protein L201_000375 [Kwoniella dendrophila CBS 6074]|uniref:TRUD domain-containing protein n=1 Tax=Kwoniella dendrophila CBS 6074 TaxID=1295534 RepID=A0AAX4JJA5_9TREE